MNRQEQIEHFVAEAHRLAMTRLREHPERLGEIRAQLVRWRERAGTSRADASWDEWQHLLDGPMDLLASAVCADTDHARLLRSMSPMSVLVSQAERAALLAQARHLS